MQFFSVCTPSDRLSEGGIVLWQDYFKSESTDRNYITGSQRMFSSLTGIRNKPIVHPSSMLGRTPLDGMTETAPELSVLHLEAPVIHIVIAVGGLVDGTMITAYLRPHVNDADFTVSLRPFTPKAVCTQLLPAFDVSARGTASYGNHIHILRDFQRHLV